VLQIHSAHSLAAHSLASYPNAKAPLGLLPLIPTVTLADHLGWANHITLRAALTSATFAIITLLLAFWGLQRIERVWRPRVAPGRRVFLVAPALLKAVADYRHVEQPLELWLVAVAAGLALM
jgi:hypothetical protein